MIRKNDTSRLAKGRAVVLAALLVLSAVATSAAIAGTAVADDHDVDATLGQGTYEDEGDEVTVRLELSPADGDPVQYDGGDVTIEYDDEALEFVGGADEGANALTPLYENNGTIGMVFLGGEATPDTTVALTFEVVDEFDESPLTIADGALAQNGDELAVEWSDGAIHRESGTGDWWEPYTDAEGVVDLGGVLDAIDDYAAGDLDLGSTLEVLDYYASGDPMGE